MEFQPISIRPFIGAKDYNTSRRFYQALGFEETVLAHNLSVFKKQNIAFYLQDAYVKDWVDNTMLFIEVDDVDACLQEITSLELPVRFPGVRISATHKLDWGQEFFVHDPSGILLHFGAFKSR